MAPAPFRYAQKRITPRTARYAPQPGTRAYDEDVPTLTEVPQLVDLPAHWRAACVIVCTRFPRDAEVWEHFVPGREATLWPLTRDERRSPADRFLLACAQGFTDGHTTITVADLISVPGGALRLVLDGLAIARGGLPID